MASRIFQRRIIKDYTTIETCTFFTSSREFSNQAMTEWQLQIDYVLRIDL